MPLTDDRAKLILELRAQGIVDKEVLAAIDIIPRESFIPSTFKTHAYDNTALPIDKGQTISQPYIVALMTQILEVTKRTKILEIGTGSGYQTLVLSHMCRRVYTIERHQKLLEQAEERFIKFRRHNITTMLGDGGLGWPEQQPFERIMVTAAADDVPPVLADQLAIGGIMVVPVGEHKEYQNLLRVERTESGFDIDDMGAVRFVPLVAGPPEKH